jgi:hypothetical protein
MKGYYTKITGNANVSASYGGGVYVASGGSFTMNGSAKVTLNTASSSGGGVYFSGNSFTMSDTAEVSGNTSSGNGGGVYISSGSFTKTSGTIYGSDETDPVLRNVVKNSEGVVQADRGAAVYVDASHRLETTVDAEQNISVTSERVYDGQWTDE